MAINKSIQFLLLVAQVFFPLCNSKDIITPSQPIRDGEILVSPGQTFALGFFSPGKSKNRYVGIWFNKIPEQTIVWVANREDPVKAGSSTALTIIGENLVLLVDGSQQQDNTTTTTTLWSTNVTTVTNISSATLTDSGNLILRDGHKRVVWESFDYPTNTFLPGMKSGLDWRTGLKWSLTSWKSIDNPAPGEFSHSLDPRGMPQNFLRNGSDPIWRTGPWNGLKFSGAPVMQPVSVFHTTYVASNDEIYFKYTSNDTSILSRLVLDDSGVYKKLVWSNENRRWNLVWVAVQDRCDQYGKCGVYGSCDPNDVGWSECTCLRGYEPRMPKDWSWRDWSDGCVRRKPLDCGGKGDGFWKLSRVKLPDTSTSRVEPSLSLEACEEECLKNCSCTAYARANISGEGSGCVIWYGNLTDIKVYSEGGQDLYIRVAASELEKESYGDSGAFQGRKKLLLTILTVIPVVLSFYLCGYWWWKKEKGRKLNKRCDIIFNNNDIEGHGKGSELPLFQFSVITAATNNFSESNMLGKGGFGAVYKGLLHNGQEIAVKRLSKTSGQGGEEFKTELTLIAKLQHRNLVRLLGCCISEREKILIYEYMQNKSLDSLIFDETRSTLLDWRKRFNIIVGIARGILYLHEDSRFRIIHRDLKVSNILLDDDLNPKISDFGTARVCGGNQTQARTKRVIGTYGYMSPEYANGGLFSIKSDAFSFGVILLEIISGKRNNYCNECHLMNLIGHVWELWKEGRVLELIDSSMDISANENEVLRCIQVALLCVQKKASDRPNMTSVVFMLGNETTMPSPKQPAFYFLTEDCSDHPNASTNRICCYSINEVSITNIEAR